MGKTVTTYLIDGDPKGTQYSFISNKICQMFVVPRSNLSYLNEQENVPSFKWKDKREKLIKEYATFEKDYWIMNSDKTFSSPSTAADFCIGSSNNGWLVWKDTDNNTLDVVYRKQLE